MKVFLGGTVSDSNWRDKLTPKLRIDYFNPVVKHWNEAAMEQELYERKNCDYVLYVITPKMIGYYSIAEVTDDSFRRPDKTIYSYLATDDDKIFTTEEIITFEKLGKKVEENGGIWLKTLDEIANFLNSQKESKNLQTSSENKYFDVFISYGRKHSKEFADKLSKQLIKKGKTLWYDNNEIPLDIDHHEIVDERIRCCHNFIFIISPHSVKSEYCLREINLALRLNKRIIPILHIEPTDCWEKLHPVVRKLNYVHFQQDVNDFDKGIENLLEIIEFQKDFVEKHTILLNQSFEWLNNHYSAEYLLLGSDRIAAEAWLEIEFNETLPPCHPTNLQCEFICESKEAANDDKTDVYFFNAEDEDVAEDEKEIISKIRYALMRQGITCWTRHSASTSANENKKDSSRAIEKTSNVVFLLTNNLATRYTFNEQLTIAAKYNKRIIPIKIEATEESTLPAVMKSTYNLEYFEKNETTFNELQKKLITVLNRDKDYYQIHRDVLVKALNWAQFKFPANLLLDGFDLETAKEWLQNNKERKHNPPLGIQQKFISESEFSRPSVFISYGRRHSAVFAAKIQARLNEDGFNVWFDKNDIPLGVDFQAQIDSGIENSDNFIFIISPHAAQSVYCQKEVVLAVHNNKRIIPIVQIDPTEFMNDLHPEIKKLNWIYCREKEDFAKPLTEWEKIDDFEKSYQNLKALMLQHTDYVKHHSQILNKALAWERNQRDAKFLLFGQERIEAEKWLSTEFGSEQPPCQPTTLQCEFLSDSKKNANNGYSDCFLSFATQNRSIREKVDKALARNGISTWVHSKDIKKGTDFEISLREGVEQADNLIYFISPEAIESEYCKLELEYAIQYNKRIVPILIQPVDQNLLNPYVRTLQYIDFTDTDEQLENEENSNKTSTLTVTERAEIDVKTRKVKTKWENAIDEVVQQIRRDANYFELHKKYLVLALKWKVYNNNPSFLLRGNDLLEAQTWLKIGSSVKLNLPLPLHEEFINESISNTGLLITEVFLCYSVSDIDFARKLNSTLQIAGKTTWFDQDTATSNEQRDELFKNIETASNFLYFISPETVKTFYCNEQLEYAKLHNKRIIPVRIVDTPVNEIPPSISTMDIIDFARTEFTTAYPELLKVLDTDREYVEWHTRWALKANDWKVHSRNNDQLLRGSDIETALNWYQIAKEENKIPKPSELQGEFIHRSQEIHLALIAKERQRKFVNRLLILIIVLSVGFIASGIFAGKEHIAANVEREKVQVLQKVVASHDGNKKLIDSLKNVIKKMKIQVETVSDTAADNRIQKEEVQNEYAGMQSNLGKEYINMGDSILIVAKKLGYFKLEQRCRLVKQAKSMYEKALKFGNKKAQKGIDEIKKNKDFNRCL